MTPRRAESGRLLRGALRSATGLLAVLLIAWGCGDSTKERIEAKKLAQGCTLNSDCTGDLVCVFERCHDACRTDEDCPEGEQRCVKGESADEDEGDGSGREAFVCQLPDDTHCVGRGDCQGEQVCGVDGECRDPCSRSADCTDGQTCANSDECVSRLPGKDRVDDAGNIEPDEFGKDSGNGGAGNGEAGTGATGNGATGSGEAGSGATGNGATGSGGTSGAGGAAPSGGAGGLVAGGGGASGSDAAGAGGEAASGGDGGDPDPGEWDYEEPLDGSEPLENDTRETPVPLRRQASIDLSDGDVDWFAVTVPGDGRAHILTLTIEQTSGLSTRVEAHSGVDDLLLGQSALAGGITASIHLSVGSGTTTLLALNQAASPGRAIVRLSETPENDEHEPNNTQDAVLTRSPIPLDTDISAQFVRPFISAMGDPADDWYPVELAAGNVTLTLLASLATARYRLSLISPQQVVRFFATPALGELGSWPLTGVAAGRHYIRFEPVGTTQAFARDVIPAHMVEQYVFRVTQ